MGVSVDGDGCLAVCVSSFRTAAMPYLVGMAVGDKIGVVFGRGVVTVVRFWTWSDSCAVTASVKRVTLDIDVGEGGNKGSEVIAQEPAVAAMRTKATIRNNLGFSIYSHQLDDCGSISAHIGSLWSERSYKRVVL